MLDNIEFETLIIDTYESPKHTGDLETDPKRYGVARPIKTGVNKKLTLAKP